MCFAEAKEFTCFSNYNSLHKKTLILVEANLCNFLAFKYLFNTTILQGYTTQNIPLAKRFVHPLLKKHDLEVNFAGRYWPITAAPIIGKFFEFCLYPMLEPCRNYRPNQFGFVSDGGTNRAIFVVETTVKTSIIKVQIYIHVS